MFGSGAKCLLSIKCILCCLSCQKWTLGATRHSFVSPKTSWGTGWPSSSDTGERKIKSSVSERTTRRQTVPNQVYHYCLSHNIKMQSVEQETGRSSTEGTRKTHWFRLSIKSFSWQPQFPQSLLLDAGKPPMWCSSCLSSQLGSPGISAGCLAIYLPLVSVTCYLFFFFFLLLLAIFL